MQCVASIRRLISKKGLLLEVARQQCPAFTLCIQWVIWRFTSAGLPLPGHLPCAQYPAGWLAWVELWSKPELHHVVEFTSSHTVSGSAPIGASELNLNTPAWWSHLLVFCTYCLLYFSSCLCTSDNTIRVEKLKKQLLKQVKCVDFLSPSWVGWLLAFLVAAWNRILLNCSWFAAIGLWGSLPLNTKLQITFGVLGFSL